MADISSTKTKTEFTWNLVRGDEKTTRSFTVDGAAQSAVIRDFRDGFVNGSLSLSVIDPHTFWQPTGWRDNDPDEAPWTLASAEARIITTDETLLDGGIAPVPGGDNPRNIQFKNDVITYDGLIQSQPPSVSMKDSNGWAPVEVSYVPSSQGFGIEDQPAEWDEISIAVPGNGNYEPSIYSRTS